MVSESSQIPWSSSLLCEELLFFLFFEGRREKIMFNDGGVLPGIMGGPWESPAPSTHFTTAGLFSPRAGLGHPEAPSESFQLGGDYSEEQEPRGWLSRQPVAGRRQGPAAGGGPVGSFCSTEEGGSPRTGGGGTSSTKGQWGGGWNRYFTSTFETKSTS